MARLASFFIVCAVGGCGNLDLVVVNLLGTIEDRSGAFVFH